MKKLFFIICLSSITSFAFSQWTWQNPLPQGNSLSSVYFTDTGTGYTVGEAGTILKTIDGGTTWTTLVSGTTNDLNSVYFADANTGYVVGEKGTILKTNNGGTNWNSLTSGTEMDLNSVCFTDVNTGYAVGGDFDDGIILKTTNGGTSWTHQSIGTTYGFNSVYFKNANTGYAVGLLGTCFKTIDGGLTWADVSIWNLPYLESVYLTETNTGYAVGADGEIHKTIDGGTNWNTLKWNTLPKSRTKINLSSIYFTDANTGYAVGGFTLIHYINADSITYHDSISFGNILKTIDGGTTWTEIVTGSTNYLRAVYFADMNTGYAVGDFGTIYKTSDGGTNWNSLTTATSYCNFYSVRFVNENTGYIVGFNANLREVSNVSYKTNNGGITWTPLPIEKPFAVYFADTNIVYAVSMDLEAEAESFNAEILKSIDGGKTWSSKWESRETGILALYFTNENTGYAASASEKYANSAILKTIDGGITWTTCWSESIDVTSDFEDIIFSFYFIDATTGFALGKYGKILKTIDGGTNWSVIEIETELKTVSMSFADARTGYLMSGGKEDDGIIFKTIDGGETWSVLLDLSDEDFSLFSICFTDANTGYAIGNYRGGIIIKTCDGGLTWTPLPIGTKNDLYSVYFTDANTGYVVGEEGTILKTTNGGGFVSINKPLSIQSAFRIYPNPATNKIFISNIIEPKGETQVSIFSINGQQILKDKFQNQKQIELDMSPLKKGIYFLRVQTNAGTETKKLVVQ